MCREKAERPCHLDAPLLPGGDPPGFSALSYLCSPKYSTALPGAKVGPSCREPFKPLIPDTLGRGRPNQNPSEEGNGGGEGWHRMSANCVPELANSLVVPAILRALTVPSLGLAALGEVRARSRSLSPEKAMQESNIWAGSL